MNIQKSIAENIAENKESPQIAGLSNYFFGLHFFSSQYHPTID